MALRRPLVSVSGALQEMPAGDASAGTAIQIPHTWAVGGEIKVQSGDTDYLVPFFVAVPAGQTARIVGFRHRLNSGTSAVLAVKKNGTVTFITTVTTTSTFDGPYTTSVADGDELSIMVGEVTGAPKNMTFTLIIEYQPATS